MSQPIVIAHHLIWSVYGSWLPNDPRGSGSDTVHNTVLAELGELHKGRKQIQPSGKVIREFYREATPLLQLAIWLFPLAISASTVFTKQHYFLDVPAGAILGAAVFWIGRPFIG